MPDSLQAIYDRWDDEDFVGLGLDGYQAVTESYMEEFMATAQTDKQVAKIGQDFDELIKTIRLK